jgi:integrase
MAALKLSKPVVERLPIPAKGQALYWDKTLRGFGVRVTPEGKRTYIVQHRVAGRTVRVTVGQHGHLMTDEARRQAQGKLGQLATGIDINGQRKLARVKAATVKEVFAQFRAARTRNKPATMDSYERTLELYAKDWLSRPWTSISRDMVLERHRSVGDKTGERTANNLMKVTRAIINFAMAQYRHPLTGDPLIMQNPVRALSDVRGWFRERPREDHLKPSEIRAWWEMVAELATETQRDYMYALLLTGCRASEIGELKFNQLNLVDGVITLPDTKNGTTHRIPISDFLQDMFHRRIQCSGSENDFVFPPSCNGPSRWGHTAQGNRLLQRVEVATGIQMHTRHGLRRTFASIGEEVGVGTYTLKKLMNHRTGVSSDITQQYAQLSIEQLREPSDRIANKILRLAGVIPPAPVVQQPALQYLQAANEPAFAVA